MIELFDRLSVSSNLTFADSFWSSMNMTTSYGTQYMYDQLLAWYCRLSVCPSTCDAVHCV